MSGYKYLRGSPLQKIDYSYSACEGGRFFKSYFLARMNAVERMSSFVLHNAKKIYARMPAEEKGEFIFFDKVLNDSDCATVAGIEKALPQSYPKILADKYCRFTNRGKGFVTEYMLKAILISRLDNSTAKVDKADETINQLRKKYEVFQRLALHYDASLKKASDDFGNISNYAMLGIIASDIFEKGADYGYLNLALKINDLVSQIKCAKEGLSTILFSIVSLGKEVKIVRSIKDNL